MDTDDNQTLGCSSWRPPDRCDEAVLEANIMTENPETSRLDNGDAEPRRPLTEAAKRALAEAEERRRLRVEARAAASPAEIGGRDGPDPVRHGDWEKDGIISDF